MVSYLRHQISKAATVDLYDETHGVFCQLIEPQLVLKALDFEENVGKIDDPTTAQAVTALHSIACTDKTEILVELDNKTPHPLRIRWMDEHGHNPTSHDWTIPPGASTVQCSQPGYLYLFAAIIEQEQHLLGAYRTLKVLPSGSPQFVLIEETLLGRETFYLETVLTDETGQDALMVAAAALDPARKGGHTAQKTLSTLLTVVQNIQNDPCDVKFQKLKFSNPQVQHYITSSSGAMYLLHLLGFLKKTQTSDDEECLELRRKPRLDLFQRANDLLQILVARAEPTFVADLATPAPWQPPALSSAQPAHWHTSGTHFITPEERWARTERWGARRGGWGH
jgi:hypothetical protein